MNQHEPTGPTLTGTSMNYNLNKEKQERALAKDRKESGL